jgi:S1-C subfamily serine protease
MILSHNTRRAGSPASVFFLVILLLTACDGGASVYVPTQAVASTPVEDLPVSAAAQNPTALPTPISEAIINAADAEYLLLTNIYERTSPSVVNIEVVARSEESSNLLDVSSGSGFIYDDQGHIVTNAHVVNGAESIRVTFNDGYLTDAEIVGVDTYSDLAVLKVELEAERLLPLPLTDSDTVRVGERVIAIGNPFGLASSMTVGIVSGLGRNLRSAELIDANAIPGFQNPAIIQVDAQINPGNSGGPLFNSHGEVIGVNTAIRSNSGIFEGVGFAVPANTVKRVIPELIEDGSVNYAWLGINAISHEQGYGVAGLAEALNLPVTSGVLISVVTQDSPAAKAGLQGGSRLVRVREREVCAGGDIIIAIDGIYVDNLDELVAHLVTHSAPGDTVNLLIVRGRETFEVPVLLEARPETLPASPNCGAPE